MKKTDGKLWGASRRETTEKKKTPTMEDIMRMVNRFDRYAKAALILSFLSFALFAISIIFEVCRTAAEP